MPTLSHADRMAVMRRLHDRQKMNLVLLRRRTPLLDFTALFAMLWAIARANVQAVTLDEADGYLGYAQPAWPSNWYAAASNHVLNSMLMRLFTSVFGLS